MSVGSGLVRGLSVTVERDVVLRRLKMRPEAFEGTGLVRPLVEATIERGNGLIAPAAVYATREIGRCEEACVIFRGTDFTIPGEKVAGLLRPCAAATLMAATIGPALSGETEKLMKAGRMTEAMVLDAFGSEAADEVVNALCAILTKNAARERLVMTRRFSPGYGDWPLTEQGRLAAELGAERIGIRVSPSSTLVPEKSVTAVAGWYRTN